MGGREVSMWQWSPVHTRKTLTSASTEPFLLVFRSHHNRAPDRVRLPPDVSLSGQPLSLPPESPLHTAGQSTSFFPPKKTSNAPHCAQSNICAWFGCILVHTSIAYSPPPVSPCSGDTLPCLPRHLWSFAHTGPRKAVPASWFSSHPGPLWKRLWSHRTKTYHHFFFKCSQYFPCTSVTAFFPLNV